nr:putative transcription elongation factor SPT5 homolog 1 [Tanacetum cinerariifolium]
LLFIPHESPIELHDLVQLDNSNFGVIIRVDSEAVQEELTAPLLAQRELCKYFEPGNHVKVISGAQEGVTGMVIAVEGHQVNIVSDTTKEALHVFSDNVVESSEVTSGISKIRDFELHDLVQLDNSYFGVIMRVDSEAIQVLKGVADRAEVQLVRLRDIKYKIDRKISAQDRYKSTVSTKDVVNVIDGPCKGRQGLVEHIYRGILVIYDRHYLEHAGFICTKSQSCILVGSSANGDRNANPLASRVEACPVIISTYNAKTTISIHILKRDVIMIENIYFIIVEKSFGNPGSWGSSPQYQPGSPRSRAYEALNPGSGWASTPGGSYSEAGTPRDNTLAYANAPSPYLSSTPGGQPPMTPSGFQSFILVLLRFIEKSSNINAHTVSWMALLLWLKYNVGMN